MCMSQSWMICYSSQAIKAWTWGSPIVSFDTWGSGQEQMGKIASKTNTNQVHVDRNTKTHSFFSFSIAVFGRQSLEHILRDS